MKHSPEWGKGKIIDPNLCRKQYSYLKTTSGAAGMILLNDQDKNWCIKLVKMMKDPKMQNDMFWHEAKSVSLYSSVARNITGCVSCPLPAHYWIHEKDPLFLENQTDKNNFQLLSDFISLFDIEPEQLEQNGIVPDQYRFISSDLLNKIYEEKLHANILLTYPLRQGKYCLHDQLGTNIMKSSLKIYALTYQILLAVLELYKSGLAHGDIKPKNILSNNILSNNLNEFFLSDIGSIHSGDAPSDTASGFFFDPYRKDIWDTQLKEIGYEKQNSMFIGKNDYKPDMELNAQELNCLLRRTLMDGYALAITIWSIANGAEPDSDWINSDLVAEVLNAVYEQSDVDDIIFAFNTLYDIENLTISKMQSLVDLLKSKIKQPFTSSKRNPLCIDNYGKEIEFNVKHIEILELYNKSAFSGEKNLYEIKIEYGHLEEQFNIVKKFNPMVRFGGATINIINFIPQNICMQPVIKNHSNSGSLKSQIYYAPDNVFSGQRSTDSELKNYKPYTLEHLIDNNEITDDIIKELLKLGEILNNAAADKTFFILPYPHDIVKIDNKWMIQPFFLDTFRAYEEFSFVEYLKMLCGLDNNLTVQNWIDMLDYDKGVGILFNLIPDEMVRKVTDHLNSISTVDYKNLDEFEQKKIKASRFFDEKLGRTKKFGKYLFWTKEADEYGRIAFVKKLPPSE